MGFVLPWRAGVNAGAPVVRVLSYNVNGDFSGADRIAAEIDHYSPDIVLLQELADPEKLAALMRTRYPTVRVSTQFLVATRFPVSSTVDPEKILYAGKMRSPSWIGQVVETPLGLIDLYDVHPLSPREGLVALRGNGLRHEVLSGRGFSEGSQELVNVNSGLRALQVADVAEAARHATHPVLIAGDTNLPGLSLVLHRTFSQYQDGFEKAGSGFGYTFPTGRGPWMRIDHMGSRAMSSVSSASRSATRSPRTTTASWPTCNEPPDASDGHARAAQRSCSGRRPSGGRRARDPIDWPIS